jgi:hypothetical protein
LRLEKSPTASGRLASIRDGFSHESFPSNANLYLSPLRSRLFSSRRRSISFAAWVNTRQSPFQVASALFIFHDLGCPSSQFFDNVIHVVMSFRFCGKV